MNSLKKFIATQIILLLLLTFNSCKKEVTLELPKLKTIEVSNNTLTTAQSGGIIENDGGSEIIASGVCWSKNQNPTINDNKTIDKIINGSFTSKITGLTPYSVYYTRAYATNSNGTAYGNTIPVLKPDSIYAGIHDNSFTYHEFASPITLNPIMDSNMLSATAYDSINLQAENDLISILLYMKIANEDSMQTINDSDIFIWARLAINSLDSISFHISRREYYAGLGTAADFNFISAFLKNDIIKSNSYWSYFNKKNNVTYWASVWDYPTDVGTLNGYDGGPWYVSGSQFRYIGIKYKGRLGWIKVDISDPTDPKFISYAIKK